MTRTALFALLLAASPAGAAEVLKVGDDLPNFTLKTLNPELSKRESLVIRDLVGAEAKGNHKLLYVSFAASYCGPCVHELDAMKTRAADVRKAGGELVVVIVDTDPKKIEAMQIFVRDKLGLDVPVASDRLGIVARKLGVDRLPMLLKVSRDGRIEAIRIGYEGNVFDEMVKELTAIKS